MLKLRNVLAGTVLAGAVLAGVAAAPAQAATASTASTASVLSAASFTKHWFDGYSGYGRGESRGERSYYKGYYYFANGRYYFDVDVWDRDHDRENTYVDFWYHDDRGWHQGRRFVTGGHGKYRFSYSARGGFDGYKFRIGEGRSGHFDWSRYSNRSW
ncbi:hypothetical protein ITP53_09660 [Nonomuraea sp. K274]|uniref:Peptidase inhibitor family I36 n=1 Tax=Nonomuraea cypriaca TaxID=1187855 RepID=A0A931EZA6_9ACTN|nr:hypothetical protein [Nonomuraea cypriaca]MBF8186006.1 hypothetical protein [Nonomuraea cypriaca]